MADPSQTTQNQGWWGQFGAPVLNLTGNLLNAGNVQAASSNALAAQTQASQQANVGLQGSYGTANSLLQPYIQAGNTALPGQAGVAGQTAATAAQGQPNYSYNDFKNSGYYQAMQAQNQKMTDNMTAQANASGQNGSGNFANSLNENLESNAAAQFGAANTANLANYNAGLNADVAAYNMYGGLSGQGASAAAGLGGQAYNTALAQGQNLTNIGTYAAQAANQGAANYTSTMGNITGTLNSLLGASGGAIPTPTSGQSQSAYYSNLGYDPTQMGNSAQGTGQFDPNAVWTGSGWSTPNPAPSPYPVMPIDPNSPAYNPSAEW